MGLGRWGGVVIAVVGTAVCGGAGAVPVDVPARTVPIAHRTATPEQQELLRRMAKEDLQPDRLKRCLDYPDPPGVHWQRATVDGMCHLQFDPRITLKDIRAELDRHGANELNGRFAKLAQEQRRDITSFRLDNTLNEAFACSCKEARDAADAWLAQSPKSPWARAASGIQYAAAAYAARGTEFIDKTPPERILRMEALHGKAAADLDLALAPAPDLTAASAERIAIDRIEGRTDDAHNRIIEALGRSPFSYQLHMEAVVLAEPRWGGASGELQAARRRLLDASAHNPMLLQVVTYLDWKAQECADCMWDMHNYQPMMDIAPSLAVLRKAGIYEVEHGDSASGAIYLSELLRFSPTNEVIARTNRGLARASLGDFNAAQSDAETALAAKADFQPAMRLLRMLTEMRAKAAAEERRADASHG
jgi:hypothetical protein